LKTMFAELFGLETRLVIWHSLESVCHLNLLHSKFLECWLPKNLEFRHICVQPPLAVTSGQIPQFSSILVAALFFNKIKVSQQQKKNSVHFRAWKAQVLLKKPAGSLNTWFSEAF
jgi:hypothetical protein